MYASSLVFPLFVFRVTVSLSFSQISDGYGITNTDFTDVYKLDSQTELYFMGIYCVYNCVKRCLIALGKLSDC